LLNSNHSYNPSNKMSTFQENKYCEVNPDLSNEEQDENDYDSTLQNPTEQDELQSTSSHRSHPTKKRDS
ncbi:4942_t:CDS:1, partial [Gigaspora margarita]